MIGFLFSTSKNLICQLSRSIDDLLNSTGFYSIIWEDKKPIYFYFLVLAVILLELLGESSSSFSTLCFHETTSRQAASFVQEKLREKSTQFFKL
ncbi:hypothetical protein I8F73_01065 [Enterococcus faecalis]|nr:hypothetical protein [Enterococcus faecalis]